EVDEEALLGSLRTLVERHESLRTRFEKRDGVALQVIEPASSVVVEVEPVESEEEVQRICRAERGYCFEVTAERLCRMRVLRVGAQAANPARAASEQVVSGLAVVSDPAVEYVVLLTLHHSVSDGWSLGVFFREWVAVYAAYAQGRPSPLAS